MVHPAISNNRVESRLKIESSSTSNTRGGTDHPGGTNERDRLRVVAGFNVSIICRGVDVVWLLSCVVVGGLLVIASQLLKVGSVTRNSATANSVLGLLCVEDDEDVDGDDDGGSIVVIVTPACAGVEWLSYDGSRSERLNTYCSDPTCWVICSTCWFVWCASWL